MPTLREQISAKTHDYASRRCWGHDYVIHKIESNGEKLEVSGWGIGIDTGDFILLQSQNPRSRPDTRYRVEKIDYCSDPRDMFHATLIFAPRPPDKEPTEPRVTLTGSSARGWIVSYGTAFFEVAAAAGEDYAEKIAAKSAKLRGLKSWWNLKANGEFVECPI